MFGILDYPFFLASVVVLNFLPGVDTFYTLTRALGGGFKHGVLSALGIGTGLLIQSLLVAAGMAILVKNTPFLYFLIRMGGAGYLMVLGTQHFVHALDTKHSEKLKVTARIHSPWKVYAQGVATNLLNPKVLLFFLALLPQFVDANAGFGMLPYLILGATCMVTSTTYLVVLSAVAAKAAHALRQERYRRVVGIVCGIVFFALGLSVLVQPMMPG